MPGVTAMTSEGGGSGKKLTFCLKPQHEHPTDPLSRKTAPPRLQSDLLVRKDVAELPKLVSLEARCVCISVCVSVCVCVLVCVSVLVC